MVKGAVNSLFELANIPPMGTLTYALSPPSTDLPDCASKLNPIDVYQSKDKNFMYYSFVAVIDDEFLPNLNGESCGYAWVNIGNWPKPLHEGAKATLQFNKGKDKLQTILDIHKKDGRHN